MTDVLTDKQEIFDTVARHLFTQGERALRWPKSAKRLNGCSYRGSGGLTCAIGCLIPDDRYHPSMESFSVSKLIIMGDNKWIPFTEWSDVNNLLNMLQIVHDKPTNWLSTDIMRDELRFIATRYRLNPSIVDTLSFGNR